MGGPNVSTLEAFRHVYNDRGRKIQHVYRGLGINCSRAFLSWGIMNTAYEHIKHYIY